MTTNAPKRPMTKPRGRAAAVTIIPTIIILTSAVIPALGYQQISEDGQGIEVSSSYPAENVVVDTSYVDVTIEEYDGEEVTWDFRSEDPFVGLETVIGYETLTFTTTELPWYSSFGWGGWDERRASLVLQVPEGTNLDLDTNYGASNLIGAFGTVEAETGYGELVLDGQAEELAMAVHYGDVRGSGMAVAGSVDLEMRYADGRLPLSEPPSEVALDLAYSNLELVLPPAPGGYSVNGESSFAEVTPNLGPESNLGDGGPSIDVTYDLNFSDLTVNSQ